MQTTLHNFQTRFQAADKAIATSCIELCKASPLFFFFKAQFGIFFFLNKHSFSSCTYVSAAQSQVNPSHKILDTLIIIKARKCIITRI